jgi:hypothetical protein
MPARAQLPVHGGWVAYQGRPAGLLTLVIIAIAAALAYAGTKIRRPIAVAAPGRVLSGLMIAIWMLSILMVLVATRAYGVQLRAVDLSFRTPPIHVGTVIYAAVTFFVILYLMRRRGWKIALASAFVGTCAAPMLFELPFDLIVATHTNPSVPPNPRLYRELFFVPLFLVELSTFSLLTMLPTMRITRSALYALAGMFAVFAAWAAFGFAYPDRPLLLAFNIASKILCFVAAISLFTWREPPSQIESVRNDD